MLRCVDAVKKERALEQTRRRILPKIAPVHWYLLMPPREMDRRMTCSDNINEFRPGTTGTTTLSRFLEELTKEVAS